MKSKSFPVLPVEPPGGRRKEFPWAVWAGEGRRKILAAERGKGKEPGGEEGGCKEGGRKGQRKKEKLSWEGEVSLGNGRGTIT